MTQSSTDRQAAGAKNNHSAVPGGEAESAYAWSRLVLALLLSTIGGVGMCR